MAKPLVPKRPARPTRCKYWSDCCMKEYVIGKERRGGNGLARNKGGGRKTNNKQTKNKHRRGGTNVHSYAFLPTTKQEESYLVGEIVVDDDVHTFDINTTTKQIRRHLSVSMSSSSMAMEIDDVSNITD